MRCVSKRGCSAKHAYLIAFAGLLVTMGRFADQFGRKRIFLPGMVIFSLGSLLCALAPTIEWLIFFRVLQGIGAAALNSVSLTIIIGVFAYVFLPMPGCICDLSSDKSVEPKN